MPPKAPVKKSIASIRKKTTPRGGLKIVGIGASAGGLEAFTELLRNLPASEELAYVLVQHLDPTHRSLLSELLAKTTHLPVREIADGTHVEAMQVYVIPPNCDLSITQGVLKLAPREKIAGPARSIDNFLQSLAADQQDNAIGVILSGAGSDGAQGLKAIKEAGGLTFAQDAGTAKYDSMPRSAIATGCVDFVLTPAKIAEEMTRLVQRPGRTRHRAAANARRRRGRVERKPATSYGTPAKNPSAWPAAPEDVNLRKIFGLLRTRTGTDFGLYRINTMRRRLARRLSLHKIKGLDVYARYLRDHPEEIDTLYHDFLINVTSFFRNPGVFEALKRRVFPRLVKHNVGGDSLRIWVAGCSTGQEPYSLAMAYAEWSEATGNQVPIQIFATDVNASVLEIARAGRYQRNQLTGISAARLQRFFAQEADGYRVQKAIRDMVIFAQQNLMTDPPFTRVDLISCRNVLIYLEPALQQRIIPAFHYALKPNGVLLLGTSESVGQFTTLFDGIEKGHKIYGKKPAASWLRYQRSPAVPTSTPVKAVRASGALSRPAELVTVDAFKEADRVTLAKYAPVSVLVSEDGEILQFRGDVHRYFELPAGKASFQLFKMAKEDLALPLQKAFHRAKRDNKIVRERGVRFDGRRGVVNIEIVPLKNLKARCFLLIFERATPKARTEPAAKAGSSAHDGTQAASGVARQLTELRQEYAETREHLANLQEAHDTSVEELQASNEEVQSANEELQSLNEELETSNEELESANEELTTLNEELATRNVELRESEQRLREQAQLMEMAPVLVRSPKDRIIFWNRGAEKLYGFTKEEALGQTSHLFLNGQFPEPLAKIERELHRRGQWDGEVQHRRKDGNVIWVATQWVVHHDANKKLRAVLEVCTDITARKQAERALRESEEFNRSILESSPDCITVLDLAGRVTFMSPGGQRLLEIDDFAACANSYWPNFWEGDHRDEAEQAYRTALSGEVARFRGYCLTARATPKWWDVVVQPVLGTSNRPEKLLAVARDITQQRMIELLREEEDRMTLLRGDIASVIAHGGEIQPLLEEIAATTVRRLDAGGARIWLLDAAAQMLELEASAGAAPANGPASRIKLGELAIGRIAATKEPIICHDVAAEPGLCDATWMKRENITSFVGYPLLTESGQVLGVVALFARHKIELHIQRSVRFASELIARFIQRQRTEEERNRLLHEATEARAEVELLNEIGKRIAAELDIQKLTQAVTDAATKLAKAEFGAFFYHFTDEKGESYSLHALSGVTREAFGALSLPRTTLELASPVAGRGVLRIGDITADTRFGAPVQRAFAASTLPIKSCLTVPVTARSGEAIGGLLFGHSKPNMFGEREERVVMNLAAQAAIAMDNARLVDQLERKVLERTARLQETISELQAFSYTVSHDLRAPLRAMQSYAQVLLEDCADRLTEPGREYLSRIENAGVRLDRLIQDVLTYSRISRSQANLQPINLEHLLRDIMEQYPMLRSPAAEIRVEGSLPVVLAEESSATQCLSNLLGNAVKFVPAGRQPLIIVRAETQGERTRVWIEDNGIGIDPKDQERIFKMFERVEHAGRYEGTGIGLAIVRKAIERMGGQVGVESEPGKGSRFWLEFKAAAPIGVS